MALIVADRVQETTPTTGTGTYTLAGAKSGFQSFAAVGDGNTTYYACTDGTDYEVGIGTYTASGTTLARTTIIESSNSDAAVDWGSGSKDIFVTSPADKTLLVGRNLYADNPSSPTAPSVTAPNGVAIGSGASTTGATAGVAIGEGASAAANEALALGKDANGNSRHTIAAGKSAYAGSFYCTAIGYNSYAAGANNATALTNSRASGADSFAAAIANNTSTYGASGANSIAMGYQAKATNSYAFSTGYQSQATGNSAIAMGFQTNASGGVALGYKGRATGGNAFGVNNNTSGGATGYLSIAIGDTCLASSTSSVAIGLGSQADAAGSVVLGSRGHAQGIQNRYVFSPTSIIGNNDGASQYGVFVLIGATTDATAKVLTTNDTTAGSNDQIILPNNSAYSFSGTIIARESAAAGSDYASWEIKGALLRDANAASTVLGNGIVNKLYATSGASAWAVALSADTTNGGLKVEVTGAAATNIRWVATVNTSEVTYA